LTKLIGSASLTTTDSGTDLTNKGDLHGYSTSNTRIPVGSNDQVLTADSAQALGVKWASAGGGGAWTILAEQTTAGSTIDTGALTAMDNYNIIDFWACFDSDAGEPLEMQIYTDLDPSLRTDAYYHNQGFYDGTFYTQALTNQYNLSFEENIATEAVFIHGTFYNRRSGASEGGAGFINMFDRAGGSASNGVCYTNAGGGTTVFLRGFKITSPSSFDGAFYTVLGA